MKKQKTERDFSNIPITNDELMAYATQHGSITLSRYIEWLKSPRTHEDILEAYKGSIEDKAPLQ